MGLGAALVDRARPLTKEPIATRVEGTTQMTTVAGSWFKARLFLTAGREDSGAQGSYVRAVQGPQLMYALRDSEGEPIVLNFDDKVEVDSPQLGRAVWRVVNQPEPIRKKRSLIGGLANLERVEEHEFTGRDV